MQDYIDATAAQADQARLESARKKLQTGEGYKWRIRDFIQAPFALVVGSLNALGTESSASFCSRYTLSSRQKIKDAEPFFEAENKLDGYD